MGLLLRWLVFVPGVLSGGPHEGLRRYGQPTTSGVSTVGTGARAGRTGAMALVWSSPPADDRNDELDQVDDDDPEPDLLDDLCDRDEDGAHHHAS